MSLISQSTIHVLLGLANAILCGVIVWCSFSRLNMMSARTTQTRYRAFYITIAGGALFSAFSPLILHDTPNLARLIVEALVIVALYEACITWRSGPPEHARRHDHSLQ